MAKLSFSPFLTKLRQKLTKNDQKLIIKLGVKLDHILTTKRGDSGSAGILERKCVIIGAPKTDTKMIKNSFTTLKMIKNDKKSTKQKKWKSDKIRKTEKVTKSEKAKK